MAEFGLIQRLQEIIEPVHPGQRGCVLGIGDDAAVLDVPPDRHLVICTDALVENVHFPAGTDPRSIGHKALAVNLSDLAAMGAEPAWFFLAMTLPQAEPSWLDSLAHGMADLATQAGIALAGGDTTSGGLNLCITAAGLARKGRILTRAGAKAGDLIVVSGRPGSAAHALACIQAGREPDTADRQALEFPQPRLQLGQQLAGLASSCIDLSDGLLADLGHILDQSRCGAHIQLESLPLPASMAALPGELRWPLQLSGGDDYELCFTLPPHLQDQLAAMAQENGIELTVIGEVTATNGIVLSRPGGGEYCPAHSGYEHFSTGEPES